MPTNNHEHDLIMEHLIDIKESQATLKANGQATYVIVEKLEKKVGIQNGRIWKLEAKYNYFIGAISIIGIVGGMIWKLL